MKKQQQQKPSNKPAHSVRFSPPPLATVVKVASRLNALRLFLLGGLDDAVLFFYCTHSHSDEAVVTAACVVAVQDEMED